MSLSKKSRFFFGWALIYTAIIGSLYSAAGYSARDGSGNYSLPAGNPVSSGTVISSATHNATNNDIASALTQSIAKDGQTAPTANLPMGGFRHTNVSSGTVATDYSTLAQAQLNTHGYVVDSSVTPNTVTLSPSPAITTYSTGQRWRFKAATTNTGATTITVSGLVSKNIFRNTLVALLANDLIATRIYDITYDGTQFVLTAIPSPGDGLRLISIQVFTSSGTYTRPAGATAAMVMALGGAGAGGGAADTGATTWSIGGGGASGTNVIDWITSGLGATETVTIGAGGTGVAGGTGNAGGNTTFGAHLTAPGGGGGSLSVAGTLAAAAGGAPVAASNGLFASTGDRGNGGWASNAAGLSASGRGAGTEYGGGGQENIISTGGNAGLNGTGFGAGGSGAANAPSQGTARAGGNGTGGLVIVWSFA